LLNKFLDRFFFFHRRKYFSDQKLKENFLESISIIKKSLGITFRDKSYLLKGLTHSSYIELYPELIKSNERLEFLGDSVLNMVVADYLFQKYPEEEEGFLTKKRSMLVNRERLYITAENIGLQNWIMYNHKYLRDSLEGLQTILADGLEAFIGALYLDKGLEVTKQFIIKNVIHSFEEDEMFLVDTNYKGQLLELTHAKRLSSPRYVLKSEEGPPHKKEFTINVYIGDNFYGTGLGRSKKAAEQEASRVALEKLKEEKSVTPAE
jgi:ribonuclease III